MSYSSSSAMINSTMSRESAPKLFIKDDSIFISSSSILNCDAIVALIFSNIISSPPYIYIR